MERPLFGDILSERRRELGYSLRQAARVLRLKEDVLIAFEESNFSEMPKTGYAQGMLSSYARYLGLDATEVVRAYTQDLDRYKREQKRRPHKGEDDGRAQSGVRRTVPHRPYVGSRGLLPTSGGYAGDMGSYATTRVHTRSDTYFEDSERNEDDRLVQPRPYNGMAGISTRRAYRSRQATEGREITTMEVGDYDDDIRFGRATHSYEAASTLEGRRSSRNIANPQRPRVRTSTRRSQSDTRRPRSGSNSRSKRSSSRKGSNNTAILIAVGLVAAISLVFIITVLSCVREDTSSSKTVPVTQATSSSANSSSSTSVTNSSSGGTASASGSSSSSSDSSSSSSGTSSSSSESGQAPSKAVTVSVSVQDGGVTWLEVECDGKSDVAQTVTGPWQQTYTVEKSITVQAGDTSVVTVLQDGQQVQFDSLVSGIGTIRIQGPGKSSTKKSDSSSSSDATSSKSTSQGTSAKLGDASNKENDSSSDGMSQRTNAQDSYDAYDSTGGYDDTSDYDQYDENGYYYDDSEY